jgi:mercuric reductase
MALDTSPVHPHAKPKINHLAIVGGGAAAFAAVTRAADDGVRVTMINDGLPLGGTCVNVGCMPSKFLLEALQKHDEANKGAPWRRSTSQLDYEALWRNMTEMVHTARKGNYHDVIKALGNITLVEGRGRLVSARQDEVNGERIQGDAILLATGARTRIPDVPGLRDAEPLTNVTALELTTPPARLAVIGGGPLGLEWAQIFHRAGSDVTLLGRILPKEEPESSDAIHDILAAQGIRIRRDARPHEVTRTPAGLVIKDDQGGVTIVDRILVATGLQPNTDHLGLETVGVTTDERGFVVVNERGETTIAGVYAAGDVAGYPGLETVAAKEGFYAAHNAITGDSRTLDYDRIPQAVFTDPQVASVGWTEERMMSELGRCMCRTLPMSKVPKALAAGDMRGFVKLVIHPDTGVILGAHAVCRDAAEIIHIPTLAIQAEWTIDQLIDTVHAFPTYAEAWKICAQSFTRDPETMSCCIV